MKKELTHNHKMTNILKTLIFSILMLAPFFAIGVKSWYVANNENAKDSYRGIYQFNEVLELNIDNYIYDENAYISTNALKQGDYGYNYKISQIKNVSGDLNYDYLFVASYRGQASTRIKIYDTFPTYLQLNEITYPNFSADYETETNHLVFNQRFDNLYQINLTFNYIGSYKVQITSTSTQYDFRNVTYSTSYNSLLYNFDKPIENNYIFDSSLSSVFYSAVQELDKTSIFSWTVDTAIYTAVNNMCVALGIVSPPLAVLITYWTLLTIIYVVIDIVIEVFIFLTHWFNDKMF